MHPDVYKRPLFGVLLLLIAVFSFFYKPAPGKQDIAHMLSKEKVTITGRVESFAVTKKDSQNVIIKISTLNGAKATGKVYARFKGVAPKFKDEIAFNGVLQTPYGVQLPGHFNWKRYLALQHIFTEAKSEQFEVLHSAGLFWRLVRTLRSSILSTFEKSLPPDLAAIASGILLGERGEISPNLYTAFQDSGAIHLLVASGGNVGFVTLLTLLIGSLIGLRRRLLLIVALATAGLYTLVAGADAPLVRAYLMAVGACSGYFLGRNSGVLQGLLLSCFTILLFNPAAVFDTGFQMSFLATLAIIICLSNYQPPKNWPRWSRFFAQIFLATLASQLVLLPVFTNVFYKLSLTGLISNMVLVPLASGMMAVTFLYYLASLLHIAIVFYFPCVGGLELFRTLVEFFASFRFSSISVTAWNAGSIIAYYSVLFLLFHLPQRKFARKLAVPCLAVALLLFTIGAFYSSKDSVYLLSEWDHRCAVVQTHGKTFVFNNLLGEDKLKRSLAALGIKEPTAVFSLQREKEIKPGVTYPFKNIWPGETIPFEDVSVRAAWEIHQSKDGNFWIDAGYSGRKKEGISYCVETGKDTLCVGEKARFVQINGTKVIAGKMNQAVSSYW